MKTYCLLLHFLFVTLTCAGDPWDTQVIFILIDQVKSNIVLYLGGCKGMAEFESSFIRYPQNLQNPINLSETILQT